MAEYFGNRCFFLWPARRPPPAPRTHLLKAADKLAALDSSAEANQDEARNHMSTLMQHVEKHTSAPAGVGEKNAKMGPKLHRLCHTTFLDTGSLEDLQKWLDEVIAITGDFGTESGFADAQCGLEKILPWTVKFCDDCGLDKEARNTVFSKVRFLFSRAVYIPGMLHILHNISSSTSANLEHFKEFFDLLKAVVDLLNDEISNRHLIATCYLQRPA